jgi:hypothetical protein
MSKPFAMLAGKRPNKRIFSKKVAEKPFDVFHGGRVGTHENVYIF